MQATLDATGLKYLTRALACISKFGDDLTIVATAEKLSLCSTNTSMSAYSRFKFDKQFFSRYHVDDRPGQDLDDDIRITGQLLVKNLLSILKHRTVERSVDRCELSIVDGMPSQDVDDSNTDQDSLESKLIVRLHCKHGVIKTHKLLLLNASMLAAPSVPGILRESKLTVTPRAVSDMLEHFPMSKGPKSDPQLVWSFADQEVYMKGLDSSLDANVRGQLCSEATISAAEFEVYDVVDPPITIAFHLREFLATVAFAEASSLSLDIRFTDATNPMFIDIEGELVETLFVIATSQVFEHAPRERETPQPRGQKRPLEQDPGKLDADMWRERSVSAVPTSARKVKPMKAAVRVDRASVARDLQGGSKAASARGSMPPPSSGFGSLFSSAPKWNMSPPEHREVSMPPPPSPPQREMEREPEPLFLPGSQLSLAQPLSQSAEQAIRESGLGIERMDVDEFIDMLEGEGEEVDYVPASQAQERELDVTMTDAEVFGDRPQLRFDTDDFKIYEDDETQLGPTQEDATRNSSTSKAFRPLFDD